MSTTTLGQPARQSDHLPHPVTAAAILAFLAVAALAVSEYRESPDFSVASGVAPITRGTPTPSPTASSPTGTSTSTRGPSRDTPIEVVIVTPPAPYKAPKVAPTPFPTCPVDRAGVTCYKPALIPTPRPIPTLAPPLWCDEAPPESWCVTRLTPTPDGM